MRLKLDKLKAAASGMRRLLVFLPRSPFGIVLSLLAFLAALNFAAHQLFWWRWDLTQGDIYSLSSASKKILKGLDDPVIVKGYFSKDLPQPYGANRDYLKDLLRAYKSYGGGNFEYEMVLSEDPVSFKSQALQEGLAPVRLTYLSKDKYEIKDGFMGLSIMYGDKKETIPVVQSVNGLEYDITSRIKKLTAKEPGVTWFLSGKGGVELAPEALQVIEQNYTKQDLDISKPLDFQNLPKALIVAGPTQAFTDAELARIEQIILRGVPTAIFLDWKEVDIAQGSFTGSEVKTGLERILGNWGLKLREGFALDVQNQNIAIQQQAGFFVINNIVSYPLMPLVTNLSRDNPVTRELDQIVFPFAAPVSTEGVKNAKVEALASTSKLSWMKEELFNYSPLASFDPVDTDPRGPFSLAVTLEGAFEASFKEPPKEIEAGSAPPGPKVPRPEDAAGAKEAPQGWLTASLAQSRLLFCSSSRVLDARIPASPSNQVFFLNVVDWLSEEAGLVAIRSKGVKLRPLKAVENYWLRQLFKFIALLFMPAAVVLYGLMRWQVRRRRRQALQEVYRPLLAANRTVA